jgi:hypothetical protein
MLDSPTATRTNGGRRSGGAAALVSVFAFLSLAGAEAALAETYTVPGVVSIGTGGSDADAGPGGIVAVTQGGCARATFAVAVGETYRCENEAHGLGAIGLLGASAGGGEWAVSDDGNSSVCPLTTGCFSIPYAFSLRGNAYGSEYGGEAVSGTGNAYSHRSAYSGTGDAHVLGGSEYSRGDAYSGTGNAYADNGSAYSGTGNAYGDSDTGNAWGHRGWAVSGAGYASGDGLAISPTRDAYATGGTPVPYGTPVGGTPVGGVAIGGQNAGAHGSAAAVAVAGTGTASSSGPHYTVNGIPVGGVAVSGGDANANGGAIAISATGDACGARVYSLAPLGRAC